MSQEAPGLRNRRTTGCDERKLRDNRLSPRHGRSAVSRVLSDCTKPVHLARCRKLSAVCMSAGCLPKYRASFRVLHIFYQTVLQGGSPSERMKDAQEAHIAASNNVPNYERILGQQYRRLEKIHPCKSICASFKSTIIKLFLQSSPFRRQ